MSSINGIPEIIAFIREYYGSQDFIPLHEPRFGGKEQEYVSEAIDSTFVSSIGSYVVRFEEMMAKISGAKSATATVTGTAALQVALRLVGVKTETEVITQALTFVATANAISYLGASPIFLDVDSETMGLSPQALKEFLDEHGEIRNEITYNRITGKRIAACVPMHTFGFPCRIDELLAVCQEYNIPVVEDAAEALGSYYKGQHTGTFGKLGIFSFNGNKVVTAGGGGAIVTNDQSLGIQAKHLTTTAKKSHRWEYNHDTLGYNFRMPNLNAALVCAQLEQLDKFLSIKRQMAKEFEGFFSKIGIRLRLEPKDTHSNYWLLCLELEDRRARDIFLKEMNSANVMSRPIWKPMDELSMYEHCYHDSLVNSKYFHDRIVNIPSSVRI